MSSPSPTRRVAITGLGLISPLGNSHQALWEGLSSGRSGISPLENGQGAALAAPFAGVCRDFHGDIDDFGNVEGDKKKAIRKGLKVMCRECQMGVAAAERALQDASLSLTGRDPERCGVVFGTDYMLSEPEEFGSGILACTDEERKFQFEKWAQQGMTKMTPLWLLKYLPNMPASHIAIYNDLRGPNNSLTLREAAGNLAVGEALRVIQRGHADVMVAGATGTRIHTMKAVHASLQEELAPGTGPHGVIEPAKACRPFDADRTGAVLAEGSGVVILEELEHARARGATIYAELSGAGSSTAADKNRVALRDLALANAIRATLRDAGATPFAVGHIQAHGLGTHGSDEAEARAIRDVFSGAGVNVPVTAAKSYFGNLGAGSGMVELIAGVLSLYHDLLFPTLNYDKPDANCELNIVREAKSPGNSFLNLSVTPQGQASSVFVKRYVA
ncbi:MAG: beta-ketoacyl-[acyl-carrier-protein] synthase family protein [Planctomycetia bacterium]|nr:beta-ketoacyl-[acyl-carrier-protein] synthase family protein [Planctomycetia bacterium]